MDIFDILGPVMVGPSSSHTAGAVRIGLIARKLLGSQPTKAHIYLHGSFAATGVGHGTDRALIAGLLGMLPDDINIPKSFELAKEKGLEFIFEQKNIKDAHPNTTRLDIEDGDGKNLSLQASSIGGGRIVVTKIDNMEVNFSGEKPTLIIQSVDEKGCLAGITKTISDNEINIATMQLYREKRGGDVIMVIEMDQQITKESLRYLEQLKGVNKVTYLLTD